MANSSSFFIQSLFIYRLSLIQYNLLIPISPFLIKDWSIWSSLFSFKKDYIACTIALLNSTPFRLLHTQLLKLPNLSLLDGHLVTPQGTHLISWKAYYDNLVGKCGPGHIPYWYKDIQQSTTIPDSNNCLLDDFITMLTNDSSFYELVPYLSSPPTTKNWIITLDEFGSPIFGKQLLVQAGRGTCSIVHWVSPNCESSPGELIKLSPCLGCTAHIPLPPSKKWNADLTLCTLMVSLQCSLILPTTNERIRCNISVVTSPFTWADIEDGVCLYYSRLDFAPDFSPEDTIEASVIPNHCTPDVSMGWSWMQIVPDAGFPNSIATYAHGIIQDNPSSSRAKAAAIYAVLTISSRTSEVTIYTDSQTAIDGL
ncbi:hypothetical protein RhiirB3_438569 [Rhizophagus irregularis]|nr:hypothetical protein RhiirB3_438569 [Rhizophagus irregularis]